VNDKRLVKIFIYSAVCTALFLSGCAADTPTANNSAANSNGNSNARTNSALAAATADSGLKILKSQNNFEGINIGESDVRVADGIKDFGIKYAVAKDKDSTVAKSYRVVGTPTIVFLDGKGAVRYFGNELPKDYAERLNSILGS